MKAVIISNYALIREGLCSILSKYKDIPLSAICIAEGSISSTAFE